MKKIKMMLLSLALIAVVGGALAFKAKFNQRWCVTDAYSIVNPSGPGFIYYCEFNPGTGVVTKDCPALPQAQNAASTTGTGDLKLCTTLSIPDGEGGFECPQDCSITTTAVRD